MKTILYSLLYLIVTFLPFGLLIGLLYLIPYDIRQMLNVMCLPLIPIGIFWLYYKSWEHKKHEENLKEKQRQKEHQQLVDAIKNAK